MKEYRVTRPKLYGFDSIGGRNLSARQGHYFRAESFSDALEAARKAFPGEDLDVQECGEDKDMRMIARFVFLSDATTRVLRAGSVVVLESGHRVRMKRGFKGLYADEPVIAVGVEDGREFSIYPQSIAKIVRR